MEFITLIPWKIRNKSINFGKKWKYKAIIMKIQYNNNILGI